MLQMELIFILPSDCGVSTARFCLKDNAHFAPAAVHRVPGTRCYVQGAWRNSIDRRFAQCKQRRSCRLFLERCWDCRLPLDFSENVINWENPGKPRLGHLSVHRGGALLVTALFGLSTAVQFGIYDLGEDPGSYKQNEHEHFGKHSGSIQGIDYEATGHGLGPGAPDTREACGVLTGAS
jgi:hypothetical protein